MADSTRPRFQIDEDLAKINVDDPKYQTMDGDGAQMISGVWLVLPPGGSFQHSRPFRFHCVPLTSSLRCGLRLTFLSTGGATGAWRLCAMVFCFVSTGDEFNTCLSAWSLFAIIIVVIQLLLLLLIFNKIIMCL